MSAESIATRICFVPSYVVFNQRQTNFARFSVPMNLTMILHDEIRRLFGNFSLSRSNRKCQQITLFRVGARDHNRLALSLYVYLPTIYTIAHLVRQSDFGRFVFVRDSIGEWCNNSSQSHPTNFQSSRARRCVAVVVHGALFSDPIHMRRLGRQW